MQVLQVLTYYGKRLGCLDPRYTQGLAVTIKAL